MAKQIVSLRKFITSIYSHNWLSKNVLSISKNFSKRSFSSGGGHMKVTIIGAAGKVGQSLCLMLKQSPLIDEVCVHDLKATKGFAMELNHVDTKCKVTAFSGKDNLPQALMNSRVIVLIASCPGADSLPLKKMWEPNAPIVRDIATECSRCSPKALLAIATDPINSIVPMVCEIYKKHGVFNPNMIFGITTIDIVRANTFVAEIQGLEPECVLVPVVGGHSEETMVPVLSKAQPCAEFTNDELETLTASIRKARENIHKMKPSASTPLSTAFAVARFVISLVKGLKGFPNIIEGSYVCSNAHPQLKYLSTSLQIGPTGVVKNLGLPDMSEYESCMFNNAIPILTEDIKLGERFVGVIDPPVCDPCDANPKAPRCPLDYCEIQSTCESVKKSNEQKCN